MRRLISFLSCTLFLIIQANAQQSEWDFYIAFEDANGQRDTLKVFWSEEATYDFDINFNEVAVTPEDSTGLLVFFDNTTWYPESLPIQNTAGPWSEEGMYGTFTIVNYNLPITLTWDISKFTNQEQYPVLDEYLISANLNSPYIFLFSDNLCNCLRLHETDSFVLGDLTGLPISTHFPVTIDILKESTINTNFRNRLDSKYSIGPNPVTDSRFSIRSDHINDVSEVEVVSISGVIHPMSTKKSLNNHIEVELLDATPGVYILRIFEEKRITAFRLLIY
mgnify:CR=1 FL=1